MAILIGNLRLPAILPASYASGCAELIYWLV
jgi:hypothetical protein